MLVLLIAFSSHAQELPKSWMPKWKVGDWWRVKTTINVSVTGELFEIRFFKFEIVSETNLKGKPGFEVKVTPEFNPQRTATFVVDKKHLSVRKLKITEKCKGQRGLLNCGEDRGVNYTGAYPSFGEGDYEPILPAFPLKVGNIRIQSEKTKKDPLAAYIIQEVHRVSAQELITKGYTMGGLFKPTGNYYEVTITIVNPYHNVSNIMSKQIWSPDVPYWVYGLGTSKWFLVEHSWK